MPEKKVKILYIEDDASSRLLIRRVLEQEPFEVLEAPTGLQGLKMVQQERPDLILMDINLPDIRGDELATKIKNTPGFAHVVIVALTAMKKENAKEMTLVAGCDGYLTKPIDLRNFPDQLRAFLRGARETVDNEKKELLHSQYEAHLVDHLTRKIEEIEKANRQLEETSEQLLHYSSYLEKVLQIISKLQTCTTPDDLKKRLIDELCENFQYDRCAFIDVDPEESVMSIHYARGIPLDEWEKYSYPFNNPFFRNLFENRKVLYIPNLNQIRDAELRSRLQNLGITRFIFAYLGTTFHPDQTTRMEEGIMKQLEALIPRLKDNEEDDRDVILENLVEYFASENFYRGGFVFIDNHSSNREFAVYEHRFLETLFRTAGYMYQNLLLLDELKYLFIRAEKEAITDPLTDLFNYRYFFQQLKREISRGRRHKTHFSLIMLDVDFFKRYNDTFGHQAGDRVLQRLARVMEENTRTSDIVARYGGEEFVIVSPETTRKEAAKLAEKLRQIIEQTDFPNADKLPGGRLTVSLGVATFPEDGDTPYRLIRHADIALYQAKANGRNRVEVYSPETQME